MSDSMQLTVRPSPLRPDAITHTVKAGRAIIDILEDTETQAMPGHRLAVEIDGTIVGPERWEDFKPIAGSIMTAVQLPMSGGGGGSQQGGGKNPVRIVATIAVIAAAAYTGGAAAGVLGLTGAAGAAVSAVTTTAITVAGNLAINKLFPPAGGPRETSRPNSATGQRNELRPFLPIPVVLGTVRMSPPLAAVPFTTPRGDDLLLNSLLTAGLGPVAIEDIRVGDTDIALVEDIEFQTRAGLSSDVFPSLFRRNIVENSPNIELEELDPVTLTTEPDTVAISIDVFFPEGISDRKKSARRAEAARRNGNVIFEIAFRPQGGSFAVPGFGSRPDTNITGQFNFPKRINYRIDGLAANTYEVRITRLTPKNNKKDGENRMLWTALRSELDDVEPILDNLSFLAIRANIDGVLDNINFIAKKSVPAFTGTPTIWTAGTQTSNPAAHYRYLLQGDPTARPVPDSKLDLPSIEDFYDFCETEGFTFNGIFEDFSSLRQRCLTVLAAGRATISRPNGLYGVTIDRPTVVPVAMISPRNSRDFSVTRIYDAPPEAFRVRFLDADDDTKPGERLVFDDGFNENNITAGGIEVLDLTTAGITTSDLAYRFGRFEIAKRRLRLETYTVTQGLDQLVLAQGDLCKILHDVLVVGLGNFRITSVSGTGGDVDNVGVDGDIVMETGKSYAARIRYVDDIGVDQIAVAPVTTVDGTSRDLTFTTPFSSGSTPAVGDLLFFGELGLDTIDAVVRDIRRIGDLEAEITLFEAAAGIHVADAGAIPAYNPLTTVPGRFYEKPPDVPQIENVFTRAVSQASAPASTRGVVLFISIKRPGSSAQPATGYLVRLRLKGDAQFSIRQSFPGSSGVLEVTGLFPGRTYEFQIQALGNPGQLVAANSAFTATQTIDIPIPATSTSEPDQVAGLELEGQGNDTNFVGRDATFVWRYTGGAGIFSLPTGGQVGQTTLPTSTGFQDPNFSHFEVTIFDTVLNEVRRVEEITTSRYTYTFAFNIEDGIKFRRRQLQSRPAREFEIIVITVDKFGGRSAVARLSVRNPPPASPLGLKITEGSDHYSVTATLPSDPDAANLLIWASETSGFTPGVDNLVASVAANRAVVTTPSGTEFFVRAAFSDAFSSDPDELNLSSEIFAKTLAINASPPIFAFEGIVFTPDAPANRVSWNAGKVTINDKNVITVEEIAAGSATFSGSPVYIYYVAGENILDFTTIADVAVDADRQVLAIYEGGATVSTGNGDAFIDGSRVVAGSILGQSIQAGQITADLIGSDAIVADKIASGAITADKLSAGQIISDSAQLGDLTVSGRSLEDFAASRIETTLSAGESPAQGNSLRNQHARWLFASGRTVESEGSPTLILFNCNILFEDTVNRGGNYVFRFRVFRDGILLKFPIIIDTIPGNFNVQQRIYGFFAEVDLPPLGLNRYEVQVQFTHNDGQNATGSGLATIDRQLWVHEVKK